MARRRRSSARRAFRAGVKRGRRQGARRMSRMIPMRQRVGRRM